MNDTRDVVAAALLAVVPDAPLDTIADDADLRDTLEPDSLDFLSFVEQLAKRTHHRLTT